MGNVKDALIAKIIDPLVTPKRLEMALRILTSESELNSKDTARFLSDADACVYAGGIVHSTLWRWRQRGLPSYEVGGRRLYRVTDLDKFIIQANRSN